MGAGSWSFLEGAGLITWEFPWYPKGVQRCWVGTSLVVQWFKICLLMQKTWVWSLVWKDLTYLRATKSVHHSYWTHTQALLQSPRSSVSKEPTCNAGDPGSIPGSGKSAGEGIGYTLQYSWASLVAQLIKNLPAMQETWVRSLGWEVLCPMSESPSGKREGFQDNATRKKGSLLLTWVRAPAASNAVVWGQRAPSPSCYTNL